MDAGIVAGRDSALSRPTPEQARAAYAAGVRVWGVYVSTRPGVGLLAPWPRQDIQVVQDAGLRAIGFCSGWDDPSVGDLCRSWGVLPLLDCEDGIRGLGTWTQPWLDASGAGLYGLLAVHRALRAPYRIVALYPGVDPGATWPGDQPAPAEPHGWQWQGTHDEFGVTVDSLWLDDWFAPAAPAPTPPADRWGSSMEGETMLSFEYAGQLHTVDTDEGGTAIHRWFDGVWHKDFPLTGLVSRSPIAYDAGYNGQLHLWGRRADGSQGHAWTGAGTDGWQLEVIP